MVHAYRAPEIGRTGLLLGKSAAKGPVYKETAGNDRILNICVEAVGVRLDHAALTDT